MSFWPHGCFLPRFDLTWDYFAYEIAMTSLAFIINGVALRTVGSRAGDYSGFIIVLCSSMDMMCLLINMFSKIGERPTGSFFLIGGSFFDTILETHFTLLFLPVILKLLIMSIHGFIQTLYWLYTLKPQKFDSSTDMEELYQVQLGINIKIRLSRILMFQASYPAILVILSIAIGTHYSLSVIKVGQAFNWLAPIIPFLDALTLILAVPVLRAAFLFPFRCRKQIAPISVQVPAQSSLPV